MGGSHETPSRSDVDVQQNYSNLYNRIYDIAFQDLPDTLKLDGWSFKTATISSWSIPSATFVASCLEPTLRLMYSRKNPRHLKWSRVMRLGANGHTSRSHAQYCS